jgi:hypothetical protein
MNTPSFLPSPLSHLMLNDPWTWQSWDRSCLGKLTCSNVRVYSTKAEICTALCSQTHSSCIHLLQVRCMGFVRISVHQQNDRH